MSLFMKDPVKFLNAWYFLFFWRWYVIWLCFQRFVLSGNLHGGSVVASYPFDDSPKHATTGVYSRTSDDEVFRYLAKAYASNHPIMKTGEPHCPGEEDETFKDGITNGAHWYDVEGMQSTETALFAFCWLSFLLYILNIRQKCGVSILKRLFLCIFEISKTTVKLKDDHRNMYSSFI